MPWSSGRFARDLEDQRSLAKRIPLSCSRASATASDDSFAVDTVLANAERAARAGILREAPLSHRVQHRCEAAAAFGQAVLVARRVGAVRHGLDQAGGLEASQPLGQDIGGDVLGGLEEVAEARLAGEQITHDEQSPAIAEEVEGVSDGAERAQVGHHQSLAVYKAQGLDCSYLRYESDPIGYAGR